MKLHGEPARKMPGRLKTVRAIAIAAIVILGLGAILWSRPAALPPSVSVVLLGYTNRVGPYALLAITNRSESAITLDMTCWVKYSPTRGSAPRRVASIEPNKFRITRLRPDEGFVQDVFVFPASQGEWQFECYAAHSSAWLETRRVAENWLRKHVRGVKFPLRSKAWHKFDTEWLACPP
jgi:hypothetical protein